MKENELLFQGSRNNSGLKEYLQLTSFLSKCDKPSSLLNHLCPPSPPTPPAQDPWNLGYIPPPFQIQIQNGLMHIIWGVQSYM